MATKVKLIADSAITAAMIDTTATPTFGGITVNGDATVTGDLNITENLNSYNVTDLDVTDQTITLGAGQTEALSGGSGIIIDGSNASILWDETNTEWDFNNNINVAGQIKSVQSGGTSFATTGVVSDMSGGSYIVVADPQNVVDNTLAGIQFSAFNGDSVIAGTYDSTNNSSIIFGTETSGTITEKMRIDSQGRVGIGGIPTKPLHVFGTDDSTFLQLETTSTTGSNKGPDLSMYRNSASPANNDYIGDLKFVGNTTGTGATSFVFSEIYGQAVTTDHATRKGALYFQSANASSPDIMVWTGGNLGIGTTNPSAKLEIERPSASGSTDPLLILSGPQGIMRLGDGQNSNGGPHGIQFDYYGVGGGATDGMSMYYRTDPEHISFEDSTGSSGNKVMVIERTGNVGIGEADPDGQLHVKGATNRTLKLDPTFSTGTYTTLAFARNGTDKWRVFHPSDDSYLSFYNDQTSAHQLTLKSNGNVGIGELDPEAGFHYTGGQALFEYTTNTGNTGFLKIRSQFDRDVGIAIENNVTSQAWNIFIEGGPSGHTNGDDSLVFQNTSGHQILSLDQNGYVHIGSSTSADRPLHVFASAEAAAIKLTRSDSSKSVELGQGSSFAFLQALNGGGLGIGGSNSNQDLFIDDNGALTSTASTGSDDYGMKVVTGDTGDTGISIYRSGAGNAAVGLKAVSNGASFIDGSYLGIQVETDGSVAWSDETNFKFYRRRFYIGPNDPGDNEAQLYIYNQDSTGANKRMIELNLADDATTGMEYIRMSDSGGANGLITSTGNGTVSYGNGSDERLKENITLIGSQWGILRNVRSVNFDWKYRENVNTDGFIAQELNEIYPRAVVVGTDSNEVEDIQNKPWQVDESKLVPYLVKALQEAMDKIDDLETRVQGLEG